MVKVVKGDLFSSGADVLFNPVNCKGVMGAGLALLFKQRFPEMMPTYSKICSNNLLRPGHPVLFERESAPHIVFFPTKDHWKQPSHYADIIAGVETLPFLLKNHLPIKSIALPALGCGLGGLNWEFVQADLVPRLEKLNLEVMVYEPSGNITPPIPPLTIAAYFAFLHVLTQASLLTLPGVCLQQALSAAYPNSSLEALRHEASLLMDHALLRLVSTPQGNQLEVGVASATAYKVYESLATDQSKIASIIESIKVPLPEREI